jgi:hypothetical protein
VAVGALTDLPGAPEMAQQIRVRCAEVGCRTSLSCISKGFGGFCSPLWRLRTGQLSSAF